MNRAEANLYVQLRAYKTLLERTRAFIAESLANVKCPYVACSFGKDSAVMLHSVLQQYPFINVRFIRWQGETELIDNYDEVIGQWLARYPQLQLNQVELSRTSLDERVTERFATTEYDSFFVGLRKQESVDRRITLLHHGTFYKMASGIIRIAPLAFWREDDVAAYAIFNELPTLNKYLSEGFSARTASRIPRADYGIRADFLKSLRQRDANAYNNLLLKFPELNAHA